MSFSLLQSSRLSDMPCAQPRPRDRACLCPRRHNPSHSLCRHLWKASTQLACGLTSKYLTDTLFRSSYQPATLQTILQPRCRRDSTRAKFISKTPSACRSMLPTLKISARSRLSPQKTRNCRDCAIRYLSVSMVALSQSAPCMRSRRIHYSDLIIRLCDKYVSKQYYP